MENSWLDYYFFSYPPTIPPPDTRGPANSYHLTCKSKLFYYFSYFCVLLSSSNFPSVSYYQHHISQPKRKLHLVLRSSHDLLSFVDINTWDSRWRTVWNFRSHFSLKYNVYKVKVVSCDEIRGEGSFRVPRA